VHIKLRCGCPWRTQIKLYSVPEAVKKAYGGPASYHSHQGLYCQSKIESSRDVAPQVKHTHTHTHTHTYTHTHFEDVVVDGQDGDVTQDTHIHKYTHIHTLAHTIQMLSLMVRMEWRRQKHRLQVTHTHAHTHTHIHTPQRCRR
jgi:hypothetical protein